PSTFHHCGECFWIRDGTFKVGRAEMLPDGFLDNRQKAVLDGVTDFSGLGQLVFGFTQLDNRSLGQLVEQFSVDAGRNKICAERIYDSRGITSVVELDQQIT